jgi:hypothetical protein
MYWNVVKREVTTNKYIGIVKTFKCFGQADYYMWYEAKNKADFLNKFSKIFKRFYYKVEFDFE